MSITATNNPYPDSPDPSPSKLDRGGYEGTAETLDNKIDSTLAEAELLINNFLTDSTLIGNPNIAIPAEITGNAHCIGVGPGTYAFWGGMVIPANNIGTLKRVNDVYSVSLMPISNTKITPWTAASFLSGDQVNYLGKDWVSNAATVAGDIPGTSIKWVERLIGYADDAYIKTFNRELFAQNPELIIGNDTKRNKLRDVSVFIKELWIDGNQVTPQDLYLSISRSADAGKWYINIWNSTITATVCELPFTTVSPEPTPANTLQLIPLTKSGVTKGYALVDWSALSTSTIYSGIATSGNIEGRLSSKCFNNAAPLIKSYLLDLLKADKTTTAIESTYFKTLTRELFAQNPELIVGNDVKRNKLRDLSIFLKELWIDGNQVTPQDLYLSISRSADAGKWYINIWNSTITATVCELPITTVSPEPTPSNTLQLIPLTKSGVIKGYALVDWSALSTSTLYNGIAASGNIEGRLSSKCFNNAAPLIKSYLLQLSIDALQNKELMKSFMISNFNNTFMFDSLLANRVTPKMIELIRNFNIPTLGAFLSTDQENYDQLSSTPTLAELQKAYVPYLWIDGAKVGTIVLFDDAGLAYIFDKTGAKKFITLT